VFETWIVVAAMYFSVCYLCSLAFARLERRVQG
jgi:ABC-type amino acid transport system permease subunit